MQSIKFEREKIEKQYIDQEARENFLRGVQYFNEWLNTDFKEKLQGEGLPFDLSIIKRVANEQNAIDGIVAEYRVKHLRSMGVVPSEEKDRIATMYYGMAENLKGMCDTLYKDYTTYKIDLVSHKDGSISLDKDQVDKHIATLGIRTFTETEILYMNKLQDVAELMTEVRNMEIENDYFPFVYHILHHHLDGGFIPSKVFRNRDIKNSRGYEAIREERLNY